MNELQPSSAFAPAVIPQGIESASSAVAAQAKAIAIVVVVLCFCAAGYFSVI